MTTDAQHMRPASHGLPHVHSRSPTKTVWQSNSFLSETLPVITHRQQAVYFPDLPSTPTTSLNASRRLNRKAGCQIQLPRHTSTTPADHSHAHAKDDVSDTSTVPVSDCDDFSAAAEAIKTQIVGEGPRMAAAIAATTTAITRLRSEVDTKKKAIAVSTSIMARITALAYEAICSSNTTHM